ncbi:unnamed protein product [Didymodactylos carnosus]|uniref:pantothenate kinase n=1 Tax=Didymodactylos carnosus TaxID=1234261 RepID=A0A8S2CRM6_9BILA|nr:unnamed protein product [Didymodactylos carnosus]CAF3498521.1 unnamed protein product [Didymodactylos carnosus]
MENLAESNEIFPWFGIDIGGTLVKLVYFEPLDLTADEIKHEGDILQNIRHYLTSNRAYGEDGVRDDLLELKSIRLGGRRGNLHFIRFPTSKMINFIEFCVSRNLHTLTFQIFATGGGAYKFDRDAVEKLKLKWCKCDELDTLINGLSYLTKLNTNECFCYEEPQNEDNPNKHTFKFDIQKPFLLVNIGSGISILHVQSEHSYRRITGTSIGGGTFLGLCCLLTGCSTYEEAITLAIHGDSTKVDKLVKDIYGGDYDRFHLPAHIVASSFGHMNLSDKREQASKEDLARATLVTVLNNIGSISMMVAKTENVDRILFSGSFLRINDLSMRLLAFAMDFWSQGRIKAIFLEHEGYFSAVGCLRKFIMDANGGNCTDIPLSSDVQSAPTNSAVLQTRMQHQLMGQPMAYDLVLKSISSHVLTEHPSKALVLSFHGSTGTGKNFVTKHIVESLYRKGFESKYVRLYVSSRDFMHNDPEHLITYKEHLKKDIEKATSGCSQSIFIFDEVDKMPIQLLDTIIYYIDFHIPSYTKPVDFRKTIFIFLSNTGGTSMIRLAQKYHLSGIKRDNYNVVEFQKALSNAAFNEEGGLWHASLIEKHLVTFFAPFLPLEREHIRTCIQRQLDIIIQQNQETSLTVLEKSSIIDDVIDLIEFAPPDTALYSVSGCKKVQQKLYYILESRRKENSQCELQHEEIFIKRIISTINMSLKQQVELLNNEIHILQKKLDSKIKAFSILMNELDTLKHERNQFKSIADHLQERCVQMKKRLAIQHDPLAYHSTANGYDYVNDSTIQLLKDALKTVQDEKEVLQGKFDDVSRELVDVRGDLNIFRQTRHRARISTNSNNEDSISTNDNQDLLKRLEQSSERINTLENDLKLIVCQKEELEIERDSFKTKYMKLNQELNKMLHGDEKRVVDIESVISENRYLKEKIKELGQEKSLAIANATKYKELLQTNRSAYKRLGKVQSSSSILTHKQVQNILKQSYGMPNNEATTSDLRAIAEALFENIKDKNLTLLHQRKTNKILANRVNELEKRLEEISGFIVDKTDQTNSLTQLLDADNKSVISHSDSFPDSITSFVNENDNDKQPTTELFGFLWPVVTEATKDQQQSKTSVDEIKSSKHTLTCQQSLKTKSDSIELEMDNPLPSPSWSNSQSTVAYLEETDIIPVNTTNINDENSPCNIDNLTQLTSTTDHDIENLHDLLSACSTKMSSSDFSSSEKNLDDNNESIENEPLLQNNTKTMTTMVLSNLTC